MSKNHLHPYRIRVSKPSSAPGFTPYVTYIVRTAKGVFYIGSNETPLALSNLIHDDAAAMRFALEDAADGAAAAKALRDVLTEQWKGNPPLTPKVEVL